MGEIGTPVFENLKRDMDFDPEAWEPVTDPPLWSLAEDYAPGLDEMMVELSKKTGTNLDFLRLQLEWERRDRMQDERSNESDEEDVDAPGLPDTASGVTGDGGDPEHPGELGEAGEAEHVQGGTSQPVSGQ